MKNIRIVLAQINPTVGDLRGNARRIISSLKKAKKIDADIIAFPELAVTGYPPEDLLLKPQFVRDTRDALDEIIHASDGMISVVGFVDRGETGIFNAAAVISDGQLVDVYHKIHLPNYGVFDEYRYFRAGNRCPVYSFRGMTFGVNVCEDIWHADTPAVVQARAGARLIVNINASPYHMGKESFREELVSGLASRCNTAIVYINMVGGQDELVFDGGSFAVDSRGRVMARGRQFREELLTIDLDIPGGENRVTQKIRKQSETSLLKSLSSEQKRIPAFPMPAHRQALRPRRARILKIEEEVYQALVLGTRDYVRKNGFDGVVIGMSGGIDSALVATIACDALEKENVHGVFMPSQYTSRESREDAKRHAKNLGISLFDIPIDGIFRTYLETLSPFFAGKEPDITEENIQARIRGNLLMAFSNKFGWLVLTTGNKSEMSVGYATLYGDMAGGFAVIKDVPKTLVYKLAEWRNRKHGGGLIPARILWKEPTAELRPDQRDTDTLPPYPVLDPILKAYVEEDKSFDEIIRMECDIACVRKIIYMIDHAEYKRRQAPPGIKITPRAFGKDRRFPITNRYRIR